jgi:4-amino-4-deoxy-L-arabinose transferase-like glycosyltransferase
MGSSQPPSPSGESRGGIGQPDHRLNRMMALWVVLLTVVILTVTSHDIGLTWDEPVYMVASEAYMSWLSQLIQHPGYALSEAGIDAFWAVNKEHPPLDKVWSGLVWAAARYAFDDVTAHRLGNILLVGVGTALLYLMVAESFGTGAGWAAVGALLTMPRFFLHAHLAALDVPTAMTMFAVCYAFWRLHACPGLRWDLVLGLVYGIALGTKFNALVEIPIVLSLWALLFRRQLRVFIRLGIMGLVGVVVWIGLWPWLYYRPLSRLTDYVDFMVITHYRPYQWYFGRLYLHLPWHFAFVMAIVVVPFTLLVLCGLGGLHVMRVRTARALGGLFALGVLIPLLIVATGLSAVFDDERLLMPIFPFLAALAGIGFALAWQSLQQLASRFGRPAWARPLTATLVIVTFLPQLVNAYTLYPHLLSYYSEAIGGLRGANHFKLETTYWAETYRDVLTYLNQNAPQGATVWVEAHDVMLFYQRDGQLRRDLRVVGPTASQGLVPGVQGYTEPIVAADIVVIQNRQSGYTGEMLQWVQGRKPVYMLTYNLLTDHGVPLIEVYIR